MGPPCGLAALLLLLLLLAASLAGAFYPNAASLGGVAAAFTDESVTEQGVLRALAVFLENQDRLPRGSLEDLKPLTPTTLFQTYYKGDSSTKSFMAALQDIIRGNDKVERVYPSDTFMYVHCEAFQGAKAALNKYRNRTLKFIESSKKIKSHLRDARESLGMALHIIQKFYSNTNWIELGNTEPCLAFGHPTMTLQTASIRQATCKDCFKDTTNGNVYDCSNNMLPTRLLTSSYKHGKDCKQKPNGKCSHGGKGDRWQTAKPFGGINKETLDPELSPHHYLHTRAGEVAVQATRDFLVAPGWGILSTVGSQQFKELFCLQGYSLAFVLDVTGSMFEDIQSMRKQMEEIVRALENSADAPSSYILVAFGDPDVGPFITSESMGNIIQEVDKLQIGGGGDCPEMALSGTLKALELCSQRSQLYLITDAGAKDEHLRVQVEDEIKRKQITFNLFHTGEYCEDDNRRKRSARKRRSAGRNVFETLVELSGGSYIETSKEALGDVLGQVMLSLNAAPVALLRVSSSSPPDVRFSAEPTLAEFAVSARASVDFTLELYGPSGEREAGAQRLVDANNFCVLHVAAPRAGEWCVRVAGPAATYHVEVTGKSMLDFSYSILQWENGYMLPVEGRLVTGTPYLLWVKPLGLKAGYTITSVHLKNTDGETMVELRPRGGPSSGEFGIPFNLSDPTPFTVAVCGLSPGNITFCRLQTQLERIESFELVLDNPENTMIVPGGASSLLVVLKNVAAGVAATFSVTARDERGWLLAFQPLTVQLEPGANKTIALSVAVPAHADDLTSTLYVTAVSSAGQGASTTLVIPLSVVEETTTPDTVPPTLWKLGKEGECTGAGPCEQHSWRLLLVVSDEHPGTVNVAVERGDPSSQLTTSQQGDLLFIRYKSSCCTPWLTLSVQDAAGNVARFTDDSSLTAPVQTTTWPHDTSWLHSTTTDYHLHIGPTETPCNKGLVILLSLLAAAVVITLILSIKFAPKYFRKESRYALTFQHPKEPSYDHDQQRHSAALPSNDDV